MGDPARHPSREGADGALAKALAQHVGQPEGWRDWHEKLNGPDAATTFERLVQDARIGEARGATLLLPVDQFEECFTTTPPTERSAFLGLLQAAFGRDLPFMVIATGRSDVLEGLISSATGRPLESCSPRCRWSAIRG